MQALAPLVLDAVDFTGAVLIQRATLYDLLRMFTACHGCRSLALASAPL